MCARAGEWEIGCRPTTRCATCRPPRLDTMLVDTTREWVLAYGSGSLRNHCHPHGRRLQLSKPLALEARALSETSLLERQPGGCRDRGAGAAGRVISTAARCRTPAPQGRLQAHAAGCKSPSSSRRCKAHRAPGGVSNAAIGMANSLAGATGGAYSKQGVGCEGGGGGGVM